MKLYTRIVMIVFLANAVLLAAVGYLVHSRTMAAIQRTVEQTQVDLAGQVLNQLTTTIRDKYAQVKRVASLNNLERFVASGGQGDFSLELIELASSSPHLHWLAVYDRDGQRLLLSTSTADLEAPESLLAEALAKSAKGEAWRSRLTRADRTQPPVMLMSAPIRSDGQVVGTLVALLDWTKLLVSLQGINPPQNVFVFNRDGYFLGSNQSRLDELVLVRQNTTLEDFYQDAGKEYYHSYIATAYDGEGRVLGAVAKHRDSDIDEIYYLTVETPEQFVFASAQLYSLEMFFFVLLIVVAAAALIVWLINRRVIKPINQLTETTKRITEGQYGLLAEVPGRDEVSQLASSFNKMTKGLAQAGRHVQDIIMSMPTAVVVADHQGKISLVNQAAASLLAVEAKALIGQDIGRYFNSKQRSSKAKFQELLTSSSEDTRRTLISAQKIKITVSVSISDLAVDDGERRGSLVLVIKDMREITQYAKRRLAEIMPVLKAVAAGDFSQQIKISPEEDEFAEHFVALNMMIEDFRSLMAQIQTKQSELAKQNEALAKLSAELKEAKANLESRVIARTKDLEDAKKSLEIKVVERTKELSELNAKLEQEVARRTLELQEKLLEVERFNRLAVGRELKMIKLKQEIARLKDSQS